VVILEGVGSERNPGAYKASGEGDSLHCRDQERVNPGELVDWT
jgi:hypothetical protein